MNENENENEPAEGYVPVIPGARWYYATYNVEQGGPVEFFYVPSGRGGFNSTAMMSVSGGNIVIDQDLDSPGSSSYAVFEIPVAVMVEFIRQVRGGKPR